ncbi:MAG: leucine-rich repeat domain-containing protein [Clostridia bacterium]|nr:leucine-rich repeat domain-containing protein [Clostridia bacterium]
MTCPFGFRSKKQTKLTVLVLVGIVLFAVALFLLFAGRNLEYSLLDDGTYAVTGVGNTDRFWLPFGKVPATYRNVPVTVIQAGAFGNTKHIRVLNVTGDLAKIEAGAFIQSGIKRIRFTGKVETMEGQAFQSAVFLKEVVLPDNLTVLPFGTFLGCTSLQYVTLPSSLTKIQSEAFRYCESLKKIDFPDTLTSIGTDAFENCFGLEVLTLREGLTSVAEEAFYKCNHVRELYFPASLTDIGHDAFGGFSSIETVHYGGTRLLWKALVESAAAQNNPMILLAKAEVVPAK